MKYSIEFTIFFYYYCPKVCKLITSIYSHYLKQLECSKKKKAKVMKVTSDHIINFIDFITSNHEYCRLFTDVWIDLDSIYKLFHHVNSLESKVHCNIFSKKLIFVSESKQYGLHFKKSWNSIKQVSCFNCYCLCFVCNEVKVLC